jgi:hypothetical protein
VMPYLAASEIKALAIPESATMILPGLSGRVLLGKCS